jgi:hypothetical protein
MKKTSNEKVKTQILDPRNSNLGSLGLAMLAAAKS